MAGLQYYFFPTDFFYPKPSKPAATTTLPPPQVTLPVTVEPAKPDSSVTSVAAAEGPDMAKSPRYWRGNKILRASAQRVRCYTVERKNNPRQLI
nr:hypothetical protein DM860_010591 [Ipomoea batatas]